MHERIVELILYLVRELQTRKRLDEVDVNALARDGYTRSEISTAFAWIFERVQSGTPMLVRTPSSGASFRMLNEAERHVIMPDAYGLMMEFAQLGLLTNEDLEVLIDRVMTSGFTSVGKSEIKLFIGGILLNNDDSGMFGNRLSLDGDDTIH